MVEDSVRRTEPTEPHEDGPKEDAAKWRQIEITEGIQHHPAPEDEDTFTFQAPKANLQRAGDPRRERDEFDEILDLDKQIAATDFTHGTENFSSFDGFGGLRKAGLSLDEQVESVEIELEGKFAEITELERRLSAANDKKRIQDLLAEKAVAEDTLQELTEKLTQLRRNRVEGLEAEGKTLDSHLQNLGSGLNPEKKLEHLPSFGVLPVELRSEPPPDQADEAGSAHEEPKDEAPVPLDNHGDELSPSPRDNSPSYDLITA